VRFPAFDLAKYEGASVSSQGSVAEYVRIFAIACAPNTGMAGEGALQFESHGDDEA
jgi:hypothetical protein